MTPTNPSHSFALMAVSAAAGAWTAGQAPFPFLWRDVALVHFGCAIPLAWWASRSIGRCVPPSLAVLLAAVVLGLCLLPALDSNRPVLIGTWATQSALRIATAFGMALSACMIGRTVAGLEVEASETRRAFGSIGLLAVGLSLLVVAPAIYVHTRCQRDLGRLADFLEQGRIGEARPVARSLLTLDPQIQWRGQLLATLAATIDDEINALEALVAAPVPAKFDAALQLRRAQQLAMLGRTDEALSLLAKLDDAELAAEVDNLRGAVHEARGEWASALTAFQRVKASNELLPVSPERTNILLRATTGIAYAQRKAGDYVGADASYEALLALAPTAETHFLLAQFHEDAQNADKARRHARRAMLLNPARYQLDGEKLIRKLTVFQFGCLRAFGG